MKFNVIIFENEPMKDAEMIVEKFFSSEGIEFSCSRYLNDFNSIQDNIFRENNSCNLYLINIDINGPEIAKKIREFDYSGYIIFITSHIELAMEVLSSRLKVLDFIDKYDELEVRLTEDLKTVVKECSAIRNEDKRIAIKVGSKYHFVILNTINYIESDSIGRKIIIHSSEKAVESYTALKDIEKELDRRFFRCHRGVIINIDKISEICSERGNTHVKLLNGDTCPLSLRRVNDLMECMNKKQM